MYFIIVFIVALWLGYKLKTLIDFLNLLKLKNYVEHFVNKFEESNFQVVKERKKSVKIDEMGEI